VHIMGESQVMIKKEEKKKKEGEKRFLQLLDEDQVEVKRLSLDEVEEAVKIMRKCSFDVTESEVSSIVKYNVSFGSFVNRMLIGVALAWPAVYDPEQRIVRGGEETNAIYLEDPAILLSFEGRGIRRILLKQREDDAKSAGKEYTMAYLYEDLPSGSIVDFITESGSQLEKLYLSENYEFFKTKKGVLAVKKL